MLNLNVIVWGISIGLTIVAFIFFKMWRLSVTQRKAQREHQLTERKRQQLRDHQDNLGSRIYNAIQQARSQDLFAAKLKITRLGLRTDSYYILVEHMLSARVGIPLLTIYIRQGRIKVVYTMPLDEIEYEMGIDRFEAGPELQIMTARIAAYSPYPR